MNIPAKPPLNIIIVFFFTIPPWIPLDTLYVKTTYYATFHQGDSPGVSIMEEQLSL